MVNHLSQVVLTISAVFHLSDQLMFGYSECGGSKNTKKLKYVHGDALSDDPNCIGPGGEPYPMMDVEHLLTQVDMKRSRQGRTLSHASEDPQKTRKNLLQAYQRVNSLESFGEAFARFKREAQAQDNNGVVGAAAPNSTATAAETAANGSSTQCRGGQTPSRLCKSSFNTTAPLYGVSLTSGKPVTIVQKFPDLLQQVVYETCDSKECDLLHGECVQTYIPYLFLVIPLGPVTLTGQDYVLVESGCACRPKYSGQSEPDPLSIIPTFG